MKIKILSYLSGTIICLLFFTFSSANEMNLYQKYQEIDSLIFEKKYKEAEVLIRECLKIAPEAEDLLIQLDTVLKGQEISKDWEEIVIENSLTKEDAAILKKDKFLITNETYRQIFSAYLSRKTPLFITSDSLLNAYHVLYEETILRIENHMASCLPDILRFILKNLEDTDRHIEGNPALLSRAKKRAMLVPGIALRLMDDSFRFNNSELDSILDNETERIISANTSYMPEWLGNPDPTFTTIDYSRYKPRGFYTRSATLKRYFRAVSWLQSIPFRIRNDEELLAILLLGNSVTYLRFDNDDFREEFNTFFNIYKSFIGFGDDWDLMTAAQEAQGYLHFDLDGDDLKEEREDLEYLASFYGKGPIINDQIRFIVTTESKIVTEPNFRIISAYRIPSAILFQKTTDIRNFNRPFPNSLEVAISLGSDLARDIFEDPQKDKLLKTIDDNKQYFKGNSLYFMYLDALRALLDEPEPDAPDFMKNRAWEVKSCNTALSGWAQLRHTWVLQAKQTEGTIGLISVPEGFVEPEPDFYSRMAELGEKTADLLKEIGQIEPDYSRCLNGISKLRQLAADANNYWELYDRIDSQPVTERQDLYLALGIMNRSPLEHVMDFDNETKVKEQYNVELLWLETIENDIRAGKIDQHPQIIEYIINEEIDLVEMWERFGRLSRRLEAIAHKQLRNVELNEKENQFIKDYGKSIAAIMLYESNSYLAPKDDALRIVDVHANYMLPEKGYLHVGIAHPRKIYVLYPWQGRNVLCIGAVMPYYEFVKNTRLTDTEWMELLDSDQCPSSPDWLLPIMSSKKLSGP